MTDTIPMGTKRDVYEDGYRYGMHSMWPQVRFRFHHSFVFVCARIRERAAADHMPGTRFADLAQSSIFLHGNSTWTQRTRA